jgi:radical SAM superfamily enzyme
MKTDCILLYGNSKSALAKYAGTFRLATELRQHGYSVQTIDLSAFSYYNNIFKTVLKNIISSKTLWIGISTTFLYDIFGFPFYRNRDDFNKIEKPEHIAGIQDFVNYVKSLNPNIKFIAGGSRKFDLERFGFKFFNSYSDNEIVEFSEWCEGKNKNLKYYESTIQGTEYENFHSSQIIYNKNDIIETNDMLPIEISRGCIFKCKFCSFPMNGKTKGEWIKRSETLRDEFNKNFELHGVTDYSFSDDTFNDSEEKVKRLYDDVFSKLNFNISFSTYIRLDLLMRYKDTVDYLKESGLKSAVFGIETINHESGKSIGKGLNPHTQFEFIREIKNNQFSKILTYSGFIIGLPKDNHDDIYKLEEFLFSDKNPLDDCTVEPLYIFPKNLYKNKSSYSEFDIEYEKYGYECTERKGDSVYKEIQWSNKFTGITFDEVYNFAQRMKNKIESSDKFKPGGFGYAFYKSMGVSEADILTLSRPQILKKYNFSQMVTDKKKRYRTRLLEISESNNVL